MISVRATGFGRVAAESLRSIVSDIKAGDPLEPVTVVVPTNYVGVFVRRLLGSGELGAVTPAGPGLVAIDFRTVLRVAELLGAPALALQGRRPVSNAVVAAALRTVLGERAGMFGPVVEHPSTERALVRVHRELRDLDAGSLDLLAAQSPRAAEVVRLHRATAEVLAADWYDEFDLMDAAVTALERWAEGDAGHGVADPGTLVVYLPRRLTAAEARVLRTAAAATDVHVLVGVTGHPAADGGAVRTCGQLGVDAGPVVAAAPPPPTGVPGTATAGAVRSVITMSDADDEVRGVVREVLAAVDEGIPLERIAVLWGANEPYARLVDEQLGAAGLTRNGHAVRRIADSLVGRTALGLLALPDTAMRRASVLELLTGAPVRETASAPALVPVTAWERIARAAGIVGGVEEWRTRLAWFARDQQAEHDRLAAGDPDDPRLARTAATAALARRLLDFVEELVTMLDDAALARSWPRLVAWLRSSLIRLLGDEDDRAEWPRAEIAAAEQLDAVLDRLGALDVLEPDPGLAVFRRTLDVELDAAVGRVGELGVGVFTGRVREAVGLDVDRVFVLGMAEGVFPARASDDSLLPDDERVAVGDALALRANQVHDDHADFLAAMAGAREGATLTFPRGDLRRSVEHVPSRWLIDATRDAPGGPLDADALMQATGSDHDWVHEVPSFIAGVRAAASPATEQEYNLASLLDHVAGGAAARDHELAGRVASFTRAVELIDGRSGSTFTRFDGNLAGVVSPDGVRTRVVSPTRLEAWAACPHAYLVRHVLGVEPLDPPETIERISPLDWGDVVHASVDELLSGVIDTGEIETIDEQALTDRLLAIAARRCDELEARGLVGKAIYWRRDRRALLTDLAELVRRDDATRSHKGVPLASELAFGLPGASRPAVQVDLGDGRSVHLRGSADRVERTEDGRLVVIDYKTGSARRYAGLGPENPVLAGTTLQLPVYALAAAEAFGAAGDGHGAAPVHAAYWFTSSRSGGWRWIGMDVDEDVQAVFRDTVGSIVAGMESGVFPHNPPEADNPVYVPCRYCNPDRLGTAELRRAVAAKAGDAALLPYLELTDPAAAGVLTGSSAERSPR